MANDPAFLGRDPRGRPSKLDEGTAAAIIEVVRGGAGPMEAAAIAGVTRGTLTDWLKRGLTSLDEPFRSFALGYQEAEARGKTDLIDALKSIALDHEDVKGRGASVQAAKFLLERRYGMLGNGSPLHPPVHVALDGSTGVDPDEEFPDAAALPVEAFPALTGPVEDAVEVAPPAGPAPEADDVELDRVAFLKVQVKALQGDIAQARRDKSHQAVSALNRALSQAHEELRAAVADRDAGRLEVLTDEDLTRRMEDAARELPEAHLRIFAEVYIERHRLKFERDTTGPNKLVVAEQAAREAAANAPPSEEPAP